MKRPGTLDFVAALAVAVVLHGAAGLLLRDEPDPGMAEAAGTGGYTVDLGPSGRAPGSAVASDGPEAASEPTVPVAQAVTPVPAPQVPPPMPTPPVVTSSIVQAAVVPVPAVVPLPVAPAPSEPRPVEPPRPTEAAAVPPVETMPPEPVPADPEPHLETPVEARPVEPGPAEVAVVRPPPPPLARPVREVKPVPVRAVTPPPAPATTAPPVPVQSASAAPAPATPAPVPSTSTSQARASSAGAGGRSGAEGQRESGENRGDSGGGLPGAARSYPATLAAWLEHHKRYPERARMRRHQGTATIRFRLDARGTVLSYDLVGSSGHSLLDEEVVSLIRRAQPMPPFPDGIGQPTLEFIVPIAFALR